MPRRFRQIDLDAGPDGLGKRPLGARYRGFRRFRRAYRQHAPPSRRMHVGAKPRPALRRNDGHVQPAVTTRPMLDPWRCGRLPCRPFQAGPDTLSAGPASQRVEAPWGEPLSGPRRETPELRHPPAAFSGRGMRSQTTGAVTRSTARRPASPGRPEELMARYSDMAGLPRGLLSGLAALGRCSMS